ncbi:hypothetical protein H1V43_25895 [Streptomyces sp. PSKA54]|uniref:Uncharacterized protein n=1 Tax=Streptomyces himalayensis subsp. aureolus TaxID=2758039 RepID=A0A7W2HI61_9ACTN|nr:hypothetical protein [Streptomyces himalayensis]MBA4864722.1 hypothetical protein [Streptomyces himalayensis subsp. aureolus]
MRLTDLLHPHLDGIRTVVDATGGALRMEPYLHLPEGVALRHGAQPVGEGELVLLSYGPAPAMHGTEADCLAVLQRMRPGGRGLIVFGHREAELPYHRLLDALVAHRCQVLRAASLDYVHLHAGAVFARTDELLPSHDWFGHPVPSDGLPTALRIAGEYVLADLVSRSLRARVLDLERAAGEAGHTRDTARDDGLAARLAAAEREKEQLATSLRRARDRVGLLESRVSMLEGSTSLRVGRALVAAARSPGRGGARLPGELYELWRARRTKGRASLSAPKARAQGAPAFHAVARTDVSPDGRMYLAHRALSVTPRDRMVIAGVLTDRTAEDFAADAVVNRLLPHDGRLLVEHTDPDAVVVQLSACTGSGPWSLAGTALAPDLDRRMAELLAQAKASGHAAVLWRDAPASAAPGLARLAWDAVLDADTGVRLARLDPATDGRDRLRKAFHQDSTRVRLARLAQLVGGPDPLDARRVTVRAAPRNPADVGRLVAQVLGQLHRPAEVVVPDPAGLALDELEASGVAVSSGPPTAPWVSDWTDLTEDRPDTLLLDLMCAQEYSGADAVGHTPAHDDYTFVPMLHPALVRRSLLLSDTPPDSWSSRGYSLFAVRGKEPS